jgi:hypothetical protein
MISHKYKHMLDGMIENNSSGMVSIFMIYSIHCVL